MFKRYEQIQELRKINGNAALMDIYEYEAVSNVTADRLLAFIQQDKEKNGQESTDDRSTRNRA